MVDIHLEKEERNIPVDQVGIKGFRMPIQVELGASPQCGHTVAQIGFSVSLSALDRAVHMSRFVELLQDWNGKLSYLSVRRLLQEGKNRLNAAACHIEFQFPFFILKKAPVSGKSGLVSYDCSLFGDLGNPAEDLKMILEIKIPVGSLCPCSKAISLQGAHNQRGCITVRVRMDRELDLKEIIGKLERAGSTELYSVLKRPDEKFVTEFAYENPKFVEDIIRDVVLSFQKDSTLDWLYISVENYESIHNHNAFASVER